MTTAASPLPTQSRRRQADGLPQMPTRTHAAVLPPTIVSDVLSDTACRGSVEEVAEPAAGAAACGTPRRRLHRTPLQHAPLENVDGLIAGESAAYEDLVAQHGPMMLAVATRYLRRSHDAEDAVQDAFLNVLRSIARFRRESSLTTWLHRIVVNCALMRLRTEGRKPHVTLNECTAPSEADSSWRRSTPTSAHGVVVLGETQLVVETAISHLPPRQRQILVLRALGTMDTKQVAEALDIGTSTVKVGSHRAHQRLKSALDCGQIQDACW